MAYRAQQRRPDSDGWWSALSYYWEERGEHPCYVCGGGIYQPSTHVPARDRQSVHRGCYERQPADLTRYVGWLVLAYRIIGQRGGREGISQTRCKWQPALIESAGRDVIYVRYEDGGPQTFWATGREAGGDRDRTIYVPLETVIEMEIQQHGCGVDLPDGHEMRRTDAGIYLHCPDGSARHLGHGQHRCEHGTVDSADPRARCYRVLGPHAHSWRTQERGGVE